MISFFNAVILCVLHIIYFNANWTLPLEDTLITAISKSERYFTGRGHFNDSSYLFINTEEDNSLIRHINDFGDTGNIVITNRDLLSRLFKKLADNGNQHRYILCDILFDQRSESDSLLQKEISRVSKIILPSHFDTNSGNIIQPIFKKKTHWQII